MKRSKLNQRIADATPPRRNLSTSQPSLSLAVSSASLPSAAADPTSQGLRMGKLLAIVETTRAPLVVYEGMPGTVAIAARSFIELGREHIGQTIGVMLEHGDLTKPVVVGVLKNQPGSPLTERPRHVEIDVNGDRLTICAGRELVLRCGKSTIALTASGHIEIRGETIVTQAVGANRIRGGSVELN